MNRSVGLGVLAVLLLGGLASPAAADVITDNLSAFGADGAEGYLKPLQESLGQALNSNFSTTAVIPQQGFYAKFIIIGTNVRFDNDDRTFQTTVRGQSTETSTIVGPGQSTVVTDSTGGATVLPGGFDLSSLSYAMPQLTVGAFKGTEAVLRFTLIPTNTDDVDDITFFGIGFRHDISQWLNTGTLPLAADVFYQTFSTGTDLINLNTFTLGVSTGQTYGVITSYGRVGLDFTGMDVKYTSDAGPQPEQVDVNMSTETKLHLSAGVALNLGPVVGTVTGDWASRFQFGFGFGVNFGRAP